MRLAFIVSHPIQYYVPLYQQMATLPGMEIKVFFTWHAAETAQPDHGFGKRFAWDIPLTVGYDFEPVANNARRPGTNHYWGLQNPGLARRVLAWRPDFIHITGYCWHSHLLAIRKLSHSGVPVLFRGDSHLLDGRGPLWRWRAKRMVLRAVFRWPAAFLCVGQANRQYFREFAVPPEKLFDCPHSVETNRFAEPETGLEEQARAWRLQLRIRETDRVLLFAGKFEDKKRPLPLMEAFLRSNLKDTVLLLVGDGALGPEVRELAGKYPSQFRVLPFQNQSKMPVVYRLGDVFVLPSAYGETWGLAVNEAMACGRAVLVSDRVGCHQDVVCPGVNGDVFPWDNWQAFQDKVVAMIQVDWASRRQEIRRWSLNWSIDKTKDAVCNCLRSLIER